MYNLLITSVSGQWKQGAYEYERGRAVREYTDAAIVKKYKAMRKRDIKELMSLPSLFAYERWLRQKASIGRLTSIKLRGDSVRVEYEIESTTPQITPWKLDQLRVALDIDSGELTRTHWAVKEVDLGKVLAAANILKPKVSSHEGNGHLPGLGATSATLDSGTPLFRATSGKVENDLVAVMMPFNSAFNRTYAAIQLACKDQSLRCQRADDIWNEPEVMQDVYSLIYRSRVVVCDFTGRNPNVFYETGLAHALGKTVIPITQNSEDVPFDLSHLRFVKYLPNSEGRRELRDNIGKKLARVVSRVS